MLIADVGLAELLWTTLWIFFLFMFIWVFVILISDIFRDHELSGWAKALWILLLIIFPLIGSLIYIIVRGPSMAERRAREASQAKADFDAYVREAAASSGGGPTDDISRLAALRDSGTITEAEFQSMKARVVGA
ncbi:MAG TPA: PLDc N-terminal domain-containing protein [Acidimicrobiales bacterium]|nr:PLDc N-terminal domain-containing protein [Acidimicrobiales bacterium]